MSAKSIYRGTRRNVSNEIEKMDRISCLVTLYTLYPHRLLTWMLYMLMALEPRVI